MEQAKLLIQHRRTGLIYEIVSCWIRRPDHCGARWVLDLEPASTNPWAPVMFLTNPSLWNWYK